MREYLLSLIIHTSVLHGSREWFPVMALKRMFNPPQLVDDDFETWEREIRLWQCVTDLDVTKQGPAVYLTLQGQDRQCCSDLTIDVLKGDDGLDKLIDKLKLLYGKNEEQYLFNSYGKK